MSEWSRRRVSSALLVAVWLLVSAFASGPATCCDPVSPVPAASQMTCCGPEPSLQCPACPMTTHDVIAFAPASPAGPARDAGVSMPSALATIAAIDSPIPKDRVALPPDGPPLYRLHAQLLI